MKKKFFPILSIVLLLISLVAPGIQPVVAEEKEDKEFEDGTYEIPLEILDAEKDEASAMNSFLKSNNVPVTITDGKAKVSPTFTGADMMKHFEVNGTEAETVSEDKEKKERTYSFEVADLDEIVEGKVSVEVPGVYDTTHNVRIQFNTEKLPIVEEELEEPKDSEDKDESEENDEPSKDNESENNDSNEDSSQDGDDKDNESKPEKEEPEAGNSYTDGKYEIDYSVDVSAMDRYMEKPAKVVIDKDTNEVTLRFNSQEFITNFEIEQEGKLVKAKRVNVDEKFVDYVFTVENLEASLASRITIDTGNPNFGEMKHEFNITFDMESLDEDIGGYENGKYTLDYSVDVSAMDRYMEKPAKVVIDQDTNEVTLRFNSQQFIANFEVEQEGKLVETKRVNVDDKFVDYVFTVENLEASLTSRITIDTGNPNFGEMKHEFNITFDMKSLEEVTEEKLDPENLADGTYNIDYSLLHETKDEASTASGYVVQPAQLKVANGVMTAYFQITDHEAIKDFKLEQNGKLQSTTIVDTNEKENTRLVAIEVEDLRSTLKSQFKVFIPSINYSAEPFARLQFDLESMEKSSENLPTPEVPTKPEKLEEGGAYTMNMRVLTEDGFEKSPVGSYIKMPVDLTVNKGKNVALITLLNSNKVKDFKIKNVTDQSVVKLDKLAKVMGEDYHSVPIVQKDEAKNTRTIALEVEDLDGQQEALITIVDGEEVTEHLVRLFFEENSIRESEGLPVEDLEEIEEPSEPESPEQPEGDYDKYGYTFFKPGTNEKSSMDGFKKGPAKVKVDEKGNYVVSMEFSSGNMMKFLKINGKEAKVIKEDKDTKVFEFTLNDLKKKHTANVLVNVPGMYETEHEVDLVFDEKTEPEGSLKTVSSGNKVSVGGNDTLKVDDSNVSIKMPANLPKGTEMIVKVLDKDPSIPKEQKIAGAIVDVTVISKEDLEDGKYTLTLPYNKDKFKASEVGIYYYDAKQESWILQRGKVDSKAGTITLKVDGFSKYAVLAKAEESEEEEEIDESEIVREFERDYTFYEKGKDKVSTMDGFKKGPAKIKEDKKGNYYVTMEFSSGHMIEYFKINDQDAKLVKESKKTKVFESTLKDLTKKHSAKVFVKVPGMYEVEHEVDLVFDKENQKPSSKPSQASKPNSKVDDKSKVEKKDKVSNYNFYKIDYNFYKPGTTDVSIMDDFTDGEPAIVREHKKKGVQYVSMTLTSADMIRYVKVNGKDVTVINENKGNMVIEFPVKDLSKKQSVKAFIEVPGMYATEHEVDLVFDMSTKKKIDKNDIPGYLTKHIESQFTGQKGNGFKDSVPDFDRDADGNIIGANNDSGAGINPKTADLNMTQIMLFSSLLLLSLVPFAIKLRRRFVTEE